MQRLISELQRRKVLRVASAYVVGGWIILQVALALQTAMNLPAWFSTVIVSLLIIGLPIALVATWFLETTPEGIKRTVASGDGALVKPQTTDYILASMLALVLVVALVQAVMPRESAPAAATATAEAQKPEPAPPALGDKSIAVLPFANLSTAEEDAFFADGLSEEILNALTQIRGIRVISRTSSFSFKGKDISLPEIAVKLGVRHILEGSVRREGDDIRITAQLIDFVTDAHVWSRTFESKFDRVFAVQHEIALAIALALDVELSASAGLREATTKNMEAYGYYLKGREMFRRGETGDISDAIELYKRAIALDPKFAEAYVGLSHVYMGSQIINPGALKDVVPLAKKAAETASRLKPNLADALSVRGALAAYDFQWEAAIDYDTKAIAIDPSNAGAHTSLGVTLLRTGMLERSASALREAGRLDPLNRPIATIMIYSAFAHGDERTVADAARRVLGSSNQWAPFGHWIMACLANDKGDRTSAERHFRAFMTAQGKNKSVVEPVSNALSGRMPIGQAIKALRAEEAKDPTFQADNLLYLVDPDNAWIDGLNARIARGDTFFVSFWLPAVWRLVGQREGASPKLRALMRDVGLVDYWRKHGWPDRCRAKGEDDFECS